MNHSLSFCFLSLQSAHEVKAAIEDLLREKFSCDNITVQSTDVYHCRQRNNVSILRANVSTYFAKDRVEQFYSYLRAEQISLFGGSVEVSENNNDGIPSPATHSDYLIYVFIAVTIPLFCVTVIFIVITALMINKSRKKSK